MRDPHSPPQEGVEVEDDETTPGYKAPKKVDLKTLQELDADDESLVKYKAQLLGQTTDVKGVYCTLSPYPLLMG